MVGDEQHRRTPGTGDPSRPPGHRARGCSPAGRLLQRPERAGTRGPDAPGRAAALAAHTAALEAGEAGYLDPATGLFVLTAGFLADRGTCCDRGCRHCPYLTG